jgi:hypothetical protein
MFANFVVIVILVFPIDQEGKPKLHKNPLSVHVPTGVFFILAQGGSHILE